MWVCWNAFAYSWGRLLLKAKSENHVCLSVLTHQKFRKQSGYWLNILFFFFLFFSCTQKILAKID